MNTKIAFVLFQTSLRADGGVQSAKTLIKHFTRVTPVIITQKKSELTEDLAGLGYEVIVRPVYREPGQCLFAQGIIAGVVDALRIFTNNIWFWYYLNQCNIKVVHCNDVLAFLYFGLGAALKRAKIIFVLRRSFEAGRAFSKKYNFAFRLSNTIVTLSKTMKSELLERLNRDKSLGDKVCYIYSGVDRECYYAIDNEEKKLLRKTFNLDDGFYIAYIGAFLPRKGQLEFIKNAALPLIRKNSNQRFIFFGDFYGKSSYYYDQCAKFVRKNQLDRFITFMGGVKNIADWYRISDIVVLASYSEGLARAMIESLCTGTPVVSFDVSSAEEILGDYECGVVVEKENYQKLVDVIWKISQDKISIQRFRKNCLKNSANLFDANKAARQFEDLYVV